VRLVLFWSLCVECVLLCWGKWSGGIDPLSDTCSPTNAYTHTHTHYKPTTPTPPPTPTPTHHKPTHEQTVSGPPPSALAAQRGDHPLAPGVGGGCVRACVR
jgi:hypothetical protein